MLATNQGLLYVLSMVVIGGMVGGGSLGYIVVSGFSQDQLFGKGLAAGIAIAALGVMLDRIARYAARAVRPLTSARQRLPPRRTRSEGREQQHGTRTTPHRGWSPSPRSWASAWPPAAGGDIESTPTAAGGSDCGDLRIAVNPWTGYVANAHVIGHVAKEKLGCNVTYPEVKEEVGWQGMADGSIDTIVENWGHPDLVKKYIDEQRHGRGRRPDRQRRASSAGTSRRGWPRSTPTSPTGRTSTSTPTMFKTSESGGKGQLLDGDPSYVTNDEALVKNLDLDYKVVVGGSEAALIQSFQSAEKNKTPLLALLLRAAVVLRRRWTLEQDRSCRPYEPTGCDADAGEGRLRLPAVHAEQADRHEVRRLRLAGGGPDQELQLDQRGPEPGLDRTSPRTACRRTTRPRSGSTTTRTRSTPGCK